MSPQKSIFCLINSFRSRRGFTLTEVLLAVMIIGLIGVALGSLTRAASREGGVGRSKIMLRNNLSTFMRTLRRDMTEASYVPEDGIAGELTLNNTTPVVLLKLAKNVDSQGASIGSGARFNNNDLPAEFVTYCFVRGSDHEAPIVPATAYRGGKIYRLTSSTQFPSCSAASLTTDTLLLDNVKYISPSATFTASTDNTSFTYQVPLFKRNAFSWEDMNSLLNVRLIVELRSNPVVNDVVEETFAMPMGY